MYLQSPKDFVFSLRSPSNWWNVYPPCLLMLFDIRLGVGRKWYLWDIVLYSHKFSIDVIIYEQLNGSFIETTFRKTLTIVSFLSVLHAFITHPTDFKKLTMLITWDALDPHIILVITCCSSFFTLKYFEFFYYSSIKWLQCGCCILWQEDNFDMGETINRRFWVTLSVISKKKYFPVVCCTVFDLSL